MGARKEYQISFSYDEFVCVRSAIPCSELGKLDELCKFIIPDRGDLICDAWLSGRHGASWYCCTPEFSELKRKELGYAEE